MARRTTNDDIDYRLGRVVLELKRSDGEAPTEPELLHDILNDGLKPYEKRLGITAEPKR